MKFESYLGKKYFTERVVKITVKRNFCKKKIEEKKKKIVTKSDGKKGRVFELLFSYELYNFVRRSEKKGSIFRHKSFNVFVSKSKVTTR